jgi:O-antigen/teichoic acid export membrane protein
MSLTKRTIKAGSWQMTSVASKACLQLFVLAVLARYVSPEEFGYIAMANMVMVFVEMLAEAGIGPAIIQKKDLLEEHIRAGFALSVLFGTSVVLLLWISAPLVAVFFHTESLVGVIRAIGFSVLITKISTVSRSRIERDMRFDILMGVDVLAYLFGYALVGVIMAVHGYGVWAIIAGRLTQCGMQTISLLVIRTIPMKPVFFLRPYKDLLMFGGGLTLVRIFDNIASQGDYFIIGRFLGSTSLGFYERASSVMAMPGQYLSFALDKALFPAMSQVQSQAKRLENAYFTATNIISLLLIPMSVLMIIIAPELIVTLLGPNWSESILPFQILSMTVVFRIFINISDTLVRATGAVYASAARRAALALMILVSCWIGQANGLTGVAIAMNLSILLGYLLMVHLSIKIIHFKLADYLNLLKNGFIIGGILLLAIYPLVTFLRMYVGHPAIVLAISIIFSAVLMILVLFSWPVLLGKSGSGFLYQLMQMMHLEKYVHRFAESKE